MDKLEEKKKKLSKEKKRLLNIFKDIDENKKKFIDTQISNLAWYNISIKELQENIDAFGVEIEYNNGGNQYGIKESPSVKTLIAYQKHVNTITNQLVDLVPPSQKKSRLTELLNE